MNYYIDFDNTLYETAKLTEYMLDAIAKCISENTSENYNDVLNYCKENFNSTLDNIYTFGEKVAKLYNYKVEKVSHRLNDVIDNGENLVFEDAKRFLEKLKQNGDKIYLLTFLPKTNQSYQMRKVMGSGIVAFFDAIIMTTELKFTLDIDYKNGIFIDDDPRDLNGLFEKNPIKVIRIRKPNNKRSAFDLENKEIEEYVDFGNIII